MRVLFWGTPDFAVPTLRALTDEGHDVLAVVTQPDRPRGRGRELQPPPVKVVAEEEGIPVLQPQRPRGEAFLEQIRALEPDISVVIAYGHILVEEVLDVPNHGSWNVHASLLPELRGAAPIHWAIARGDRETGVTIMRMAKGMDAGPILHQISVPIEEGETSSELSIRLSEIGAEAMIEALTVLALDPTVQPREQEHELATFAPKVSREVARIDWSRSAVELECHVRAMDEVPGAWTSWRGQGLKLFRPTVVDGESATAAGAEADSGPAAPGTVLRADPGAAPALVVATGTGAIGFSEAQPPGKRRMEVEAWLRGRGAEVGDRFE